MRLSKLVSLESRKRTELTGTAAEVRTHSVAELAVCPAGSCGDTVVTHAGVSLSVLRVRGHPASVAHQERAEGRYFVTLPWSLILEEEKAADVSPGKVHLRIWVLLSWEHHSIRATTEETYLGHSGKSVVAGLVSKASHTPPWSGPIFIWHFSL